MQRPNQRKCSILARACAHATLSQMSAQLDLFGRGEPHFDATFADARRIDLAQGAWLELVPHWLRGHQALFDMLVAQTRFRTEQRLMYERMVEVPRLYAVLGEDGPIPPLLQAMQGVLSSRYRETFARISLGYYRDGRDSVAFHGDRIARTLPNALVATVSVGAARRFLLRPAGGGKSSAFSLGRGDLLVMGGSCQRTWQHAIPKSRTAGAQPRIAIMFRPHWAPLQPEQNEP
jgi:alkylated DNA repair dioxygenase AlkB